MAKAPTGQPAETTAGPLAAGSTRADSLALVHGLNAARAIATILVLIAHAGIPYMSIPLRTTVWLVHDGSYHGSIDVLLCFVNAMAMPLFFLMAGMSAGTALGQGSPIDFLRRRLHRLGLPLLIGTFTLIPACYVLWGLGLLFSERAPMGQLYRFSFPSHMQSSRIGLFHLWFLEYLLLLSLLLCLIVIGLRWLQKRWPDQLSAIGAAVLNSIKQPWTLAAATAIVLMIDLDGAYRLHNSLIPDLMRCAHYFVFFVAGALLARLPNPTAVLRRYAGWNLGLAACLFAALVPWFLSHVAEPLAGNSRLVLALGQSLFVWLALFGGLGTCIRYGSRHPLVRYLSEASFWIYLIHVPVVALLQLLLWQVPGNVWLKFAAATTGTLALSLLSYEYCVRYSYLGELLNGGRKRLPNVAAWRKEYGWVATSATAILSAALFLWTQRDGIFGPHFETVVPGEVYRSHRLSADKLDETLRQHDIRTVINLTTARNRDRWLMEQRQIAEQHGVSVLTIGFEEHLIPSSYKLRELAIALRDAPKPVLLQGLRTPTLGGLGSAVAILLDEEGSCAAAREQFSWQHFQVEGYEHCLAAAPVRDYEAWLAATSIEHSPRKFLYWALRVHRSPEQMGREGDQATELQAKLGAPRFTERYR